MPNDKIIVGACDAFNALFSEAGLISASVKLECCIACQYRGRASVESQEELQLCKYREP